MRNLLVLSFLFLSACGTATLVSTRFKPTKSGTVKLQGQGLAGQSAARNMAPKVMANFCKPQRYEIVGTDSVSEIEGAYANPMIKGAVNYGYTDSPLVHFECVD